MGRVAGRIFLVPLALCIAATVAGYVLLTLGVERITRAFHDSGTDERGLILFLDLLRQGLLVSKGLTLLPVLALVLIGEVARIRSSIYYIIGGGVALAVIPLLGGGGLPAGALWQVLATAGFAGGLVYWMLAGRNA